MMRLIIALFSLAFIVGCATAPTRDPWQAVTVAPAQLQVQP